MPTPLEIFAIQMQNNEPSHYARMPHLLHYCTYIHQHRDKKGNPTRTERKRLSPWAINAYLYIKQVAGKSSKCWMNGKKIAEGANMTPGMLSKVKLQELTIPIEQMDGKSLLTIEKKKKRHTKPDGTFTITTYDHITVNDLWNYNNAFMSVRNEVDALPLGFTDSQCEPDASSQCESGGAPSSQYELALQAPSSQYERIIENREDSFSKEEEPAANGALSLLHSKGNSLPSGASDVREQTKPSLPEQAKLSSEKVAAALRVCGADENFIREMLSKYPVSRIKEAGLYYNHMMSKKRSKTPSMGYMRRAIENGWKLKEGAK